MWEAIDAASTKPFGFLRFTPGPGAGGHCLPVDPSYLSWRVRRRLGQSFRFVELANDVNDHMPDYVVRRVMVALNREQRALSGSRVLLLGLAYKRNAGDDHVDARVVRVEATADEIAAADAVLLLVDHDAFDLDLVAANARYVFDSRHRVPDDGAARVEYL